MRLPQQHFRSQFINVGGNGRNAIVVVNTLYVRDAHLFIYY